MLRLPTQHHEVLGQWIETSALAYTWNVLVSPTSLAQQVRSAFFPQATTTSTTQMALRGALLRLMHEHDDDSKQTADIEQFMELDTKRDYDKKLTLCSSGEYVQGLWHVLISYNVKKWNLIDDDAKGLVEARAVCGDVLRE